MTHSFHSLFGVALLIFGVALIIWVIAVSYSLFSGQQDPFPVFEPQERSIEPAPVSQEEEAALEDALSRQLESFFPQTHVTRMLNLGSWALFASLCIFGGAKIAGIGIAFSRTERKDSDH